MKHIIYGTGWLPHSASLVPSRFVVGNPRHITDLIGGRVYSSLSTPSHCLKQLRFSGIETRNNGYTRYFAQQSHSPIFNHSHGTNISRDDPCSQSAQEEGGLDLIFPSSVSWSPSSESRAESATPSRLRPASTA
jgi:hypothetical protein